MEKSDKRSRRAFEITKNVKTSIADTLADVRSGGLVGELKTEIAQLQAERDEYHNQYHLCEAKLLAQKAINKQLGAEYEKLRGLGSP